MEDAASLYGKKEALLEERRKLEASVSSGFWFKAVFWNIESAKRQEVKDAASQYGKREGLLVEWRKLETSASSSSFVCGGECIRSGEENSAAAGLST